MSASFPFEKLTLFEKLKKSAYKRLEEYSEFRICEAGKSLVRQGELTQEFYVVLEGLLTVFRTGDDGEVRPLGNLGPGDWFGEMSALSHQPRSATVKTDVRCVVLEIPPTLFHTLYGDKTGSFARRIDERYRKIALADHLRRLPIFRDAPQEVMSQLAAKAELTDHALDQKILAEGNEADAVYLIRSGTVKRVRSRPDGGEEVEAYLCDNSSFGESALTEERTLRGSFVTQSKVSAVRLTRMAIEEVLSDHPGVREDVLRRAAAAIQAESGEGGEEAQELFAGQEAVHGNEALVIDLHRCTRCNLCVESCVAVHEDRVPRLSKRGIRTGQQLLTSACYNCQVPECMLACNFGAIRRDIHGNINFILDNCTGCTACEAKCPYGVIRMAEVLPPTAKPAESRALMRLPLVRRFFRRRRVAEGDRVRKAIKCDLCAGLPFEACVYNCPCQAIRRMQPEEIAGTR